MDTAIYLNKKTGEFSEVLTEEMQKNSDWIYYGTAESFEDLPLELQEKRIENTFGA